MLHELMKLSFVQAVLETTLSVLMVVRRGIPAHQFWLLVTF